MGMNESGGLGRKKACRKRDQGDWKEIWVDLLEWVSRLLSGHLFYFTGIELHV